MKDVEVILGEELAKHFSLQVDLRVYEDLMVKLEKGDKSYLNVTPQHEGVVLYLPVPRMTRERREQLAHDAKGKIFNEYKKALNDIYVRFEKKSSQSSTKPDEERHTRQLLLDLKHAMETKGADLIETKRKELLTEMA
ncbi:ribosome recycling factor [Ancylostoma ceylanicum]|nr:ribosome recycling factor [Ancylostoma ceylanicum]